MPNNSLRPKVEQGRAAKAYEHVKDASLNSRIKPSEFKSYTKKVPMMIKSHGLAPTLAFMKSKNRDEYNTIYADIIRWLKDDVKTIAPGIDNISKNGLDFIEYLVKLDSSATYRAITSEVLAYLNWYRRFAEAITSNQ